MPMKFEFAFSKSHRPAGGVAVLLQVAGAKEAAGAAVADPEGVLPKAAKVGKFTGKALKTLDIVAPHGSPADRILLLGLGDGSALTNHDWLKAGGAVAAKLRSAEKVTVFLDAPGVDVTGKAAADFALGMEMNAYSFDSYKTKKSDDEPKSQQNRSRSRSSPAW